MSPALQHECTRVPVTALASQGALLIAAEGPFLQFFHAKDSQYISSKRVFEAQTVHGISVYSTEQDDATKLVVWGGRLIRALEIDFTFSDHQDYTLNTQLSDVAVASDWILDLVPCLDIPNDRLTPEGGTCAAITAHNALVRLSITRYDKGEASESGTFTISVSELTSSSRSILYSAHLLWEPPNRVLVAAGTAFGELIFWSWSHEFYGEPVSRIHRIFLGHEGSIFGVRISKELPSSHIHQLRRVIASCSDDRTIRIWDVSDVNTSAIITKDSGDESETLRANHTGFSNESFDARSFTSSECLASGWGHASRVWSVHFLETHANGPLFLLSAGEDATSRIWKLAPSERNNTGLAYKLLHLESTAHHDGKNIWSLVMCKDAAGRHQVACGAADSKIIAYPLDRMFQGTKEARNSAAAEYTLNDVLRLVQPIVQDNTALAKTTQNTTKIGDFLRSYCFIDESVFMLTTNSGKVFVGFLQPGSLSGDSGLLSRSTFLTQYEDLRNYSVCAGGLSLGIAFLAGTKGNIYMYSKGAMMPKKIHNVSGKVGAMFAVEVAILQGQKAVALLVTLVGQNEAQLLFVDTASDSNVFKVVIVPIFDSLTGSIITSTSILESLDKSYLFLGFRRGSIAMYQFDKYEPRRIPATLFRVIGSVHGDETVTCMTFETSTVGSSSGYLLSVGRDGRFAVHSVDLSANGVQLVHNVPLPIGPNIEGLYFHEGHLCVHGFTNKKWVLHDVTREEEVMGIETGGAHRSWAFQPHLYSYGGTLVWTRASGMHIYNQTGLSHTVIRSGGHGREIKAVAVSPKSNRTAFGVLIATGAEDTNIKLFQYVNEDLVCRITLRKHTTGIQHLQWSQEGDHLFSSGGCEEFYVWRIRRLPSCLGIGAICEYVYAPESEHADLRIMSFDLTRRHDGVFIIAMVFSDSSLKVYAYAPHAAIKWQRLAVGVYFTSCLTQCMFLSEKKLWTAGTDGHAVIWSLPHDLYRPTTDSNSAASTLEWNYPLRIHQNSSKVMISRVLDQSTTLIVSGGDDGSLAFLLVSTSPTTSPSLQESSYTSPPVLLKRAHASAVTACAIITCKSRIFVVTSGNDEWVKLWEVIVEGTERETMGEQVLEMEDQLSIRRHKKIKTNVADVSSMAVLDAGGDGLDAKVLLCGVGMEVIRVEWGSS